MSLNRTLAGLINTSGDVKSTSLDNVPPSGLDSAQVLSIAGGLTVYATLDDLPTSGLTSGDQAFITATNRIYVSNGSGWYNVALINATPRLTIDPIGAVTLATDGTTPTFITLTATDSDNPIAALTYSVESDGNFAGLGTITQNIYDPEYNNGAIIDVTGNGSDFFKREVTTNGVRIMGAGTVGGQTAVPDAWLEKVGRTFELFTDPDGAGINETSQRALIQNLSGDSGTYHAGFPTIQRVARGAGADYTPNFLSDSGISYWNLTDLFDNTVQNDMVWYLNSTGSGYGDGDNDAQEVIEHAFHTLHMHGLDAQSLKMYPSISSDWNTGPLYNAMVEAYDAGKWDPSGYNSPANAFKTDGDAFQVAAKEYLFLLNFCMFEYSSLWEGGSLAPEWTDDMRTPAGIQANNPLGYALHNTYIAPVISKPSLATIRSIFQDGNTPAQDDPSLAGASGYVVSPSNASFTITPLSEDSATTTSAVLTFKASDGINFGSGTTTFSLTFITIVANSAETTILLKADTAETDNQADASTNNHTITENGNVTSTAFTPYHPGGYSVAFAGSDDYIGFDNGYIATNGTWWNSSGFTLELWFYKTVSTGTTGTVFDNRQSSTTGFLLTNKNTGWDMYLNGNYLFQNVGTEKVGQWVHLALVASGTTVTLYEDGTSLYTTGSAPNTSSYAYFGRSQNTVGAVQYTPRGTNVDWPGYMYDIRISSGSRYTTAFTPSETPHENDSNTILLACSSPMLKDKSSNNHEITVFGNGISTARFTPHDHDPYTKAEFGGSVYFDGVSGTKLTIPVSASLQKQAGGDFTFEAWIYPIARTSYDMIVTCGDQGVDFGYTFFWHNTSYHLMFEAGTSGWSSTAFTSSSNDGIIQLNEWQHVAFMYSGGNLTLFRNGKVALYQASAQLPQIATSGLFALGGYMDGGTQYPFKGYMANVRITQSAVYTSNTNFTPPAAPLTAIANTQLLTCTNKNDIWDEGSGNLLSKAGNATTSNTQRKFTSSSAVYLDGAGDSISFTPGYDDPLYNFGTRDWTIEGWFYIQTLTGGKNLFSFLRAGTNEAVPHIYTNSTDLRYYVLSTDRIDGAGALTVNTWHHIAVTRSGNDHKLFVDGTQVGSTWTNAQTYVQGRPVLGDYHSSLNTLTNAQTTHGYVQDLRITNGLARYTANFTPPTAEFDG